MLGGHSAPPGEDLNVLSNHHLLAVSFTSGGEVNVESDGLLLVRGNKIKVSWIPASVLPQKVLEPEEYTVDILLLQLNTSTGAQEQLSVLASNIPNNGFAEVVVEYPYSNGENVEESIHMALIEVSVNTSTSVTRGLASDILNALGKVARRVLKLSRLLYTLARWAVQRVLCEIWGQFQSDNTGEDILRRLPPCPRTSTEAAAPNSGLREENFALWFFHPGASKCFRQRVTDKYVVIV